MSEAGEDKQSTETTGVPEGVHEAAPEGESLTRTWGEWGGRGARPRAGESPRQTRGPAAGTGRMPGRCCGVEWTSAPSRSRLAEMAVAGKGRCALAWTWGKAGRRPPDPQPLPSLIPSSIHLGMEPLLDLSLYPRKAKFLESDLWVQGKTESTLIRGLVLGFVLFI